MSNLSQRTITGSIYVLLLVAGVLWNEWLLALLLTFFIAVGTFELSRLQGLDRSKSTLTSIFATALGILAMLALIKPFAYWLPLTAAVFGAGIAVLMLLKTRITVFLLSLLYVVLPLTLMMSIRAGIPHLASGMPWVVMGMLIIIWVNDTGAYLTGRFLGRTPMAPRISPKKTWEGLAGGVIFAMLAAWLLSLWVETLTLKEWLILFILTVIFGTLGDLLESLIKRQAGVKDSGNLLPGHGGVLDRIDSLLLALPFVFAAWLSIFAP